ncbi:MULTISPECIES: type II toxin-antitoxin system Phd/YefM family antitoxin [Aeromonas]|uniref:type II toxin-antitoxin system Phd/YefM family antitoxin n=1 Tax=Aeromonas TaxID=642 RepID=UPI0005A60DA6|nr:MULTISPECIES: type II toxin-antitoxin system prevent-host-death family antitoxin [Aeromonas]
MYAINYSQARQHLAETMDSVTNDCAPVMITRQGAEPVIMLSLAEYNALQETAHLLRSPKNAARLMQGIAEHKAGKATPRELLTE